MTTWATTSTQVFGARNWAIAWPSATVLIQARVRASRPDGPAVDVESEARSPEYVTLAMRNARHKQLPDGTYFGEIPGFQGLWANEATESATREEGVQSAPASPDHADSGLRLELPSVVGSE